MFVLFGTRQQTQKVGHVADFCPICREISPFLLLRTGAADHLYGISLGIKKNTIGFRRECLRCGTSLAADANDYQGVIEQVPSDREDLIRQTFPNIHQARAERLGWEQALHSGEITPLNRRIALLEPFKVLFPVSEELGQGIHLGGRGGAVFIGSFLLAAAVFIGGVSKFHDPHQRSMVIMAAGGIVAVGAIAAMVLAAGHPARVFAKKVLPGLVKALTPLKPTSEELADCLARLKRADYKIGRQTKLKQLCRALGEPESGEEQELTF